MKSLNRLQDTLAKRRARTKLLRRFMTRSSVATILREGDRGVEVLLIKRAEKQGDRWSGHMAFPGGRAQIEDVNLRATAMRETREEIGFHLSMEQYVGRLSDVMTFAHGSRRPMVVSPYVFRVEQTPEFVLNHEVAEVLWVPLSFLANKGHRDTMRWERNGVGLTMPCYFFQGRRIWGLTLKMLDELVFDIFL